MPKHAFVMEGIEDAKKPSFVNFTWDSKGEIFKEGLSDEDHVFLDDDFLNYISDSLRWVSSWNPSSNKECKGLNYYGVTIIEEHSLITFKGIVQAWHDLFGFAPESIVLKGSYFTIEGEDRSGQYEILEYKKTDLTKKLKKLINMVDRALIEDKCILHFGI